MPLIFTFDNDTLTASVGALAVTMTVKQIENTWDALSHFPDRRARLELEQLASSLNYFAGAVDGIIARGGAVDADAEVERFARRHIELTRRAWAMESRCMSWFIVGPSNFPVARNEKRMSSRDRAYDAKGEHTTIALKSVERAAFPYGAPDTAIRGNNPDAPALIRAKIAKCRNMHSLMKAANAAIREAKTEDEAALAEAVRGATGLKPETCAKMVQKDCFGIRGFAPFSLSGELAEIKRLELRLANIEIRRERGTVSKQHNTTAGAVEVIENGDADRMQIKFPGKPDAEVRSLLKSAGFRWAPSEGAWQRHLNNAGRWAAERVISGLQINETQAA